jgi:hypothetical protein
VCRFFAPPGKKRHTEIENGGQAKVLDHLFALFPRYARKKRKPKEIGYRSAEGQKTPTA